MKKILYRSRRLPALDSTVDCILDVSRHNNRRDNVTGVLLYDDRFFLQFLEGEEDAIARCFLRIAADPRHTDIELGCLGTSPVRLFRGWSLGEASLDNLGVTLATFWRRVQREACDNRLMYIENTLLSHA